MAVAAGCFLTGQPGGRAGRVLGRSFRDRLARAAPHGSARAQEGPGQKARHQGRQRRPAPAGPFTLGYSHPCDGPRALPAGGMVDALDK